jgi:hypothetical protein
MGGRQFPPESRDGGDNSRFEWPANFSGRKQLSRPPHGWIQTTRQSGRRLVQTHRACHFFYFRDSASERRLAVDCCASMQRRENEFATLGHFDGNRYNIDQVLVDHREGTEKPAMSTEGFSSFACTQFVTRCHGREFQAGKTVDGRNVRHLRPASIGVCTDDPDTKFFESSNTSHTLRKSALTEHLRC